MEHTCYASLDDLPQTIDHVILAVGDERIEAAFRAVIESGAKACTIFTSLVLDSDEGDYQTLAPCSPLIFQQQQSMNGASIFAAGRLMSGQSVNIPQPDGCLSADCRSAYPHPVSSIKDLQYLPETVTFPVALKTAEPGISHKADVGDVKLDIQTPDALNRAYEELTNRLGANAILSSMIGGAGLEMILGLVQDDDFGPVVVNDWVGPGWNC